MPVQPDFDIEARIPTDQEARKSLAPVWCDLAIKVTEDGEPTRELFLTRAAGELLIDAVHEVMHPWSGITITEHIWRALDVVVAELVDGTAQDDSFAKGQALGLAHALACLRNPLDPPVDAIREEAMDRYNAANEEDDDDMPFG